MKILSASAKETFNFAKKLAEKLNGGEILGLIGGLGAGKTVFVKGLAAGLGIKKNIASPTFILMRVYPVRSRPARIRQKAALSDRINPVKRSGIKQLAHIDAYRLKSAKDLTAMGAAENFGRRDTITVIEWADKIKKILPKKTRFIAIAHKGGSRIIKF